MPTPIDIKLLQKSKTLEILFDNNEHFTLSCEYLRVYSPSAENRGHGEIAPQIFPKDKQEINILNIEPVGHYGIKIYFDDGHNTGIYSWEYLYKLCVSQAENLARYQASLNNI